MSYLSDIKNFHKKFGLSYKGPCRALDQETFEFRRKFLQEELNEWSESMERIHRELREDVPNRQILEDELCLQLDALVDLLYVLLGTAYLQGFKSIFKTSWKRVHRANMSKIRAKHAGQSKRGSSLDVVKPVDWQPPVHNDLVRDRM